MEQHASTKETPGPFDALDKAAPGEPMFPLLARDPAAPGAITKWAHLRRNLAFRLYGTDPKGRAKKALDAELTQCANAEAVALEMTDWRAKNDAPAPVVSDKARTFSGLAKTAEELAEAERATAILDGVRHLREAAYHTTEGMDKLRSLGLMNEESRAELTAAIALVNGQAEKCTPKRGA